MTQASVSSSCFYVLPEMYMCGPDLEYAFWQSTDVVFSAGGMMFYAVLDPTTQYLECLI
jgi:hypothetical protein